jgi:uncharacterized membrane protein YecN with MAPEG domain
MNLRAWVAALALSLAACVCHAQTGPEGVPVSDEVVRDAEFGVSARHFGLERRVAMYQWRANGPGYEQVWSETPIDSTGYAPGHENPPFPLRGKRWIARRVMLDGKLLDRSAVEQLGQWRLFRPNFSALPGNLAATFQPEGDGLGTAENPLAPQVGDLRVGWRELVFPPLEGRVLLQDGVWIPDSSRQPEPAAAPLPTDPSPMSLLPRVSLLFAGLHALLLLLLSARVSRWRYRAEAAFGDAGNIALARAIRVQANFIEYVPIALVLLALLELAGLPSRWLWVLGSLLLLARLLHAWGLSLSSGSSFGRYWGTALTWMVLMAMAIAAVWMALANG